MARRGKIILLHPGMRQLLTSGKVQAEVHRRAENVLAAAKASAPVESGAYRDSLEVVDIPTVNRVRSQVRSNADYAMRMEANTGHLSRALGSAG